ncbi:hypothetical protein L596_030775 [Steinernema carpocapsae]|uniref:Uncharacterized protein n=1 Tax=Steinernema carpocapsae TaxID=34508 RepID=A0A4U5LNR0_STECR|nr:hypothetical protein L596_030775 [Steinernema carpocapsae]
MNPQIITVPLIFAVCFLDGGVFAMRKQGVAVKGRLLCGDKALKNTKVKIFDVDRNPGDSDDLLDEKFTDANGEFVLDGTTRELSTIEPELRIYHDCNDGIRPCQRKVVIEVPTKYIHHGKVKEWYNIGELNVKQPFPNEDRSCDFV